MVYKSGLISCDILGANPLDVHIKRVSKYHRDYGTKTWHLLYQAESRFRSEELPDFRRQLTEEKDEIEKSGGTHPFKKEDPWRQVWARAVSKEMDHFWQEEFITLAMMVRFDLKSIGEVVDGDAPHREPGRKQHIHDHWRYHHPCRHLLRDRRAANSPSQACWDES